MSSVRTKVIPMEVQTVQIYDVHQILQESISKFFFLGTLKVDYFSR